MMKEITIRIIIGIYWAIPGTLLYMADSETSIGLAFTLSCLAQFIMIAEVYLTGLALFKLVTAPFKVAEKIATYLAKRH